jgi:hypothetical protein
LGEIDFRITLRGFESDMPQPVSDHVEFDAGLQKVDGARVAQRILTLLMNLLPPSFTTLTIPSTANT